MEDHQAEFHYDLISQTPHDITQFHCVVPAIALTYELSYSEELHTQDECLTPCTKVSHSHALSNRTAHLKYFYDVH